MVENIILSYAFISGGTLVIAASIRGMQWLDRVLT